MYNTYKPSMYFTALRVSVAYVHEWEPSMILRAKIYTELERMTTSSKYLF